MSNTQSPLDDTQGAGHASPTTAPAATALPSSSGPEETSSVVSEDVNAPYGLSGAEWNWSLIQKPLERVNYMLRPRYHREWKGSWIGTRRRASKCEDSIPIGGSYVTSLEDPGIVLDAVHTTDGRQVLLKLWNRDIRDGPELDVLEYFSDPIRATDSANHVVPLLDTVMIEGWENAFEKILVEPLLRDWNEPPFVMVAEGLSFIIQILEGLEYMHSNNVAHGDIHSGNILMDASAMFPDGFHGAFNLNRDRRVSEKHLKRLTRIQAPVKYYFIDFGSSSMFPSEEERTLVRLRATVWPPPEYLANPEAPIDPFKHDIYALGLTLIGELTHRPGLHFVIPVFRNTILDDPTKRPTAAALKADFVQKLSILKPSQMRRKIGWSRKSGLTAYERMCDTREYLRVLWHSYRYGLPKELFPSVTPP